MENNSKLFPMVMICVLAMVAVPNTSAVLNHRDLMGEDKGDGNVKEPRKLVSSPPPIAPLIGNHSPTDQGHNLPHQSPVKSANSDSAIPSSQPLVDGSKKLLPPPGPENLNPGDTNKADDKISQNPPNKEENKTPESPKKEENKAPEGPKKEESKAPKDPKKEDKTPLQSPEKGDHKAPQTPKMDDVQKQNKETSKSGESDEKNSKNETCETANASTLTCRTGELIACLLQPGTESTDLFILVQNTGEDDLYVNITSPGKIKIDSKPLNLPKQSNKKVTITADASMGLKIILSTDKGDCVLETKTPTPDWLSLQQFPAYAAHVKPMHGAYFLFGTIIIVVGTWAFCKFRKKEKRADTRIPYQRLEMVTQARSASAPAHVIPTDNWDQGWDDNWDDEESVIKTSAKKPAEDVSPNDRSSRPENTNQNGWEIDWDD